MTKLDLAISLVRHLFSSVKEKSSIRRPSLSGSSSRIYYKGKLDAICDIFSILCSIKNNDVIDLSKYGYK